jgi:hypothetical protein
LEGRQREKERANYYSIEHPLTDGGQNEKFQASGIPVHIGQRCRAKDYD